MKPNEEQGQQEPYGTPLAIRKWRHHLLYADPVIAEASASNSAVN
jgi:hypothetical protein